MSPATLTQFLIDIARGHRKEDFANDPLGVITASPLDDATRAALLEQDVGTLWLAGAHPMALLYFARARGWANERYYRCIEQAELRKSDPKPAGPTAELAPARRRRSSAPHAR